MTTRDLCFSLLLSSAALGFSGCGSTNNQAAQGGSRAGGTSGSTGGGAGGSSVGGAAGASVGGGGGSSGGGTGGTTVASCINIADDLIADFTTDNGLSPVDGRSGGFYVYGDGSLAGQFDPPLVKDQPYPIDTTTGNTCSSPAGSFHVKATGWGVWGAALGADFMPRMPLDAGMAYDGKGFKTTYDASKYKGISFWAKAAAPLTRVQVSFPDVYTDAAANPSIIDPSISSCVYSTGASNCSPYLVKLGDSTFPNYQDYQIDTTWKRFDIFFEDTLQDQYNTGFVPPGNQITVKYLTSVAIQVNANFTATDVTPNDFEIWVDDINFIE